MSSPNKLNLAQVASQGGEAKLPLPNLGEFQAKSTATIDEIVEDARAGSIPEPMLDRISASLKIRRRM
jgi:hypothetical protein